ncbi:hypothetical protein B296_00054463 [Ensete ventricosum]|uniref:Uncharacterized protein n=1 Tax=Ensete ventricosum TaxID=4639 RepID=A0A426Y3V3_ENSVE|nr:hypothetical protein B296_00054463 [Ensete ventricosum]
MRSGSSMRVSAWLLRGTLDLYGLIDGRPTRPDPRGIIVALVGRFEGGAKGVGMVKQLYCSSSEVLINTYYQNEVVVEELKKGGASSTIGKVEAQATELICQLEDVRLVGLTKHLKEVRGHNRIMEDVLLRLIRELDMVKKHNSKLIEEVRDPKLELEEDPFIGYHED